MRRQLSRDSLAPVTSYERANWSVGLISAALCYEHHTNYQGFAMSASVRDVTLLFSAMEHIFPLPGTSIQEMRPMIAESVFIMA